MGHCTSKDHKDQKRLNRRIEEQIRKDQSMSLRIIKLLLLGKLCSAIKVVHKHLQGVLLPFYLKIDA